MRTTVISEALEVKELRIFLYIFLQFNLDLKYRVNSKEQFIFRPAKNPTHLSTGLWVSKYYII